MLQSHSKVSFENTSIAFSSKSDWALKKAYWIFKSFNYAPVVKLGSSLLLFVLKLGLPVKGLIKNTVFEHFCGGETIKDSEKSIQELGQFNIGAILDFSVEGEKNEKGFDATAEEIKSTIIKASKEPNIPFSVFKASGIGNVEILTKVQEGKTLNTKEQISYDKFTNRFEMICDFAHQKNVAIFVDAEETWIQNVIDELTIDMMPKFNTKKCIVYNTYQMYRKDSLANLKSLGNVALKEGFYPGVKLVRGAYMEKEAERAKDKSYPNPIHDSKEATDKMYDDGIRYCVESSSSFSLCAGTHNEQSSLLLTELLFENGLQNNDPRFWFAQLYGMSDHISFNLSNAGYNVAKYLPYGPVAKVMPYLVRRAQENRSVAGQSSRESRLISEEIQRRKLSI